MTQDAARFAARTPRTVIRPATEADAGATWAFRSLPQVNRWLTFAPASPEEWASLFAEPDRLARTSIIEHEGAVVGDLYLHVYDAWTQAEVSESGVGAEAEIGWAMDPSYGGRGLATEAVTELVRFCFADLGVRRLVARCFADNEPSWRLMERIGMRRESHTVGDALHRTLGWVDSYAYGLLVDEWRLSGASSGLGPDGAGRG